MKIGDIVQVSSVSIRNTVGGTENVKGPFRVKLIKHWDDDESGTRYEGILLDSEDMLKTKVAGTSEFTPEHYKQYGNEMYLRTLEAYQNFDPSVVFFGELDIVQG